MTFDEAIHYLFTSAPMFQKIGANAYKPGLGNIEQLDAHWGHPHQSYPTIHIAGTNGKGSVSHTLAAICQSSGYKTGLFTSPHLVDFRERIRVNGEMIDRQFVIDFIEQNRLFFENIHPSFFEITTMMAFCYFKQQQVDIAIIETGMGGRLDSTNIIRPLFSVITNISFDHMQFLGDTLSKIAFEKAGIIKTKTPVVIGEAIETESEKVFLAEAQKREAPILFAEKAYADLNATVAQKYIYYQTDRYPHLKGSLKGYAQIPNTRTLLSAIDLLNRTSRPVTTEAVYNGFEQVVQLTGLKGRWQVTTLKGIRTIIDTGHNEAGMRYNIKQLLQEKYRHLHFVIGMVKDKDIDHVLRLLPSHAFYHFVKADIPRGLEADQLKAMAEKYQLKGKSYNHVAEGALVALSQCSSDDLLFIGGSNFVVAEIIPMLEEDCPFHS